MTWVLLAMFLIVVITVLVNGSQVSDGFRTFFARIERRYTDGIIGPGIGIMMHLFRLSVVALALYWCQWNLYVSDTPFSPTPFVLMILLTTAAWGVHRLLLLWVCATFSLRQQMQAFVHHYLGLWTVLAIVLYCLVLVGSFVVSPRAVLVTMAIATGLYPVAVLLKTVTLSPMSLRSLVYVPLYVLTVDVLPFAGLFFIGKYIVTL